MYTEYTWENGIFEMLLTRWDESTSGAASATVFTSGSCSVISGDLASKFAVDERLTRFACLVDQALGQSYRPGGAGQVWTLPPA